MLRTAAHIFLVAGCMPVLAASPALAQSVEGASPSPESSLMDQSTLPNAIELKGSRPKADSSVMAPAATTLPEDLDAFKSPDSLALPDLPSQVTIRELRPLTLAEVEQLVEVNNPSLKAASSQVEQAKSAVLAAISAWYPTVNLTANGLPQYLEGEQYRNPAFIGANSVNPETGDPIRQPNTYTSRWSANFSVQAQWNLIDPARVPQISAARDNFEKASDAYLIALRELRLQSSTSYFQLQRQDEQVRIGQESVRASLLSLRDARARYQAGVATKLEVLEAQTQLSRDRQVLTDGLGGQARARRSLAALLDLPQDVTPTAANPSRVLGIWQPSLQESIIAAYAFREELDQFILDISINNSNANAALAAVQPVLSIFNNFSTSKNQGQANRTGSIDMADYNWNVSNAIGLNASWAIFDGGRARAQYRQNKQRAEESKFNFASERDRIRSEVEESFYNLREASQNIHTTSTEVLSSTESLRLARLRFQAGVTTQREVVDTQRDLTNAEVRYANAITDYNISIAELRRRTGLDQVLSCSALNLPARKPNQIDLDIPIEPQPNRPACEAPVPVLQG
ncbi:TolC-like outer membrane efflux protein/ RND family [Synechococcus sp. SYN20]|nr:TolC-like outer membrane efflux protein/ RND family [Synechococcus sp. SYN20]